VLLPLILAGLLWGWDRWQAKRGKRPEGRLPVHFGWLYALAFIACLTHPALDWLNNYGIRLLEPFSQRWFYGDTLFIIDIWLWLGLGFATWLSLRREKRVGANWRGPARLALLGTLAYAGANYAISAQAEAEARASTGAQLAIANAQPLLFWRREMIVGGGGQWQVDGRPLGTYPLWRCDLADAAERDPRVRAFLFWSRAPFVERMPAGGWILSDARFASPGGGRFSVILPASACDAG
jgi:inner membrane protein